MRGQWNISPTPPFSYPDYRDLRDQNHSFEGILGYHHDWLTLTGGAQPERIYVANVTANYFDVLGVKPLYGRFFRAGRRNAGTDRSLRCAELLVLEDALCGRPGSCGQVAGDCSPPGDGDRRGAGRVSSARCRGCGRMYG